MYNIGRCVLHLYINTYSGSITSPILHIYNYHAVRCNHDITLNRHITHKQLSFVRTVYNAPQSPLNCTRTIIGTDNTMYHLSFANPNTTGLDWQAGIYIRPPP